MRLSEAIRRGSKIGPQIRGEFGDGRGGTCALGAALMVIAGYVPHELSTTFSNCIILERAFPNLRNRYHCPCCKKFAPLQNIIAHLNDTALWTRERIAGWIEAHIEVPTYSMLQIQEFMGEPIKEQEVVHVR
jgi:hypothetical protein